MNVSYTCQNCGHGNSIALAADQAKITCADCGQTLQVPPEAIVDEGLTRCLVCPSTDLYVRKNFPQRLGVLIVVVGFAASCVAWYFYMTYLTFAILFATALIDVGLYVIVGDVLMCYRCGAIYRGAAHLERHGAFSLETHERHRQMAARLAERKLASKPNR